MIIAQDDFLFYIFEVLQEQFSPFKLCFKLVEFILVQQLRNLNTHSFGDYLYDATNDEINILANSKSFEV